MFSGSGVVLNDGLHSFFSLPHLWALVRLAPRQSGSPQLLALRAPIVTPLKPMMHFAYSHRFQSNVHVLDAPGQNHCPLEWIPHHLKSPHFAYSDSSIGNKPPRRREPGTAGSLAL